MSRKSGIFSPFCFFILFGLFVLINIQAFCANEPINADISANEPKISVFSKVDRSELTIGDPIIYTLEVTSSADIEVRMPPAGINLGSFEIQDYKIQEPIKTKEGKIIQRAEYKIAVYEVGEFELPSVTVGFKNPSVTEWQELASEPIKIKVNSVVPSEAKDIRDIKNPVEIVRNLKPFLYWGIFTLITLALLFFLIWFGREYKRRKALKELEALMRPAHELAFERLKALKSSGLSEKGHFKEYYIELSEILRLYLHLRYSLEALESTTTELLENISRLESSLKEVLYDSTLEVLERSDLVKFAKFAPDLEHAEQDFQTVWNLVEKTYERLEQVLVKTT